LFEYFFYGRPLLLKILKNLRTPEHEIVERKLIRLNSDCVVPCSASAVFSASVLFQDKYFSTYNTINNSDVAVLPLSFNDYVALHQVICPNNLLSASGEEVGLRHLLGISELSYLSKSKSLKIKLR
jgi:hypothetical protein